MAHPRNDWNADELEARITGVRSLRLMLQSTHIALLEPLEELSLSAECHPLPRFPMGFDEETMSFDSVYGGGQGITVFSGPYGCGKSQIAMSCGLTNAHDAKTRTCVVYLDGENYRGDQRSRAMRWYGGSAPFAARFPLIDGTRFFYVYVGPKRRWNELMHFAGSVVDSSHEAVLIVLDSLQSMIRREGRGDFFGAQDRIMASMESLVNESAGRIRFLALSELNKDKGAKGGQAEYTGQMVLRLTKDRDQGSDAVQVELLKNRNGPEGDLGLHRVDYKTCRLTIHPNNKP